MNLSSNLSSITAHQSMLNTTANNIAHVNTDGFVPKRTVLESKDSSDVVANVAQSGSSVSKGSQTDLAKEIPDLMVAEAGTSVNVTAIKTQDEMLGTLLDIKS